ncbi:unnamed protein product [Heligmosomoides polygyrus]|uniref:Peptidase S1 domain-containing protein n=1 Tax=Heligmosomoides polygyrus TaxID=6339 RepID=A0A183F7Q9_HELPZ|nr:unnamed protein product [Heligmosomoides polygyrus]
MFVGWPVTRACRLHSKVRVWLGSQKQAVSSGTTWRNGHHHQAQYHMQSITPRFERTTTHWSNSWVTIIDVVLVQHELTALQLVTTVRPRKEGFAVLLAGSRGNDLLGTAALEHTVTGQLYSPQLQKWKLTSLVYLMTTPYSRGKPYSRENFRTWLGSSAKLCFIHSVVRLQYSGVSFRLTDGNEVSGNVQVFFKGAWQPVCAQDFGQDAADILNSSTTNTMGWHIKCGERCALRGLILCRQLARIRSESGSCGVRRVTAFARDPLRVRYARVVGGFETVAGAFPWTAAIRIKATGAHHCGASILDKNHLITAAHCFEDDKRPSSYVVIVGDYDNTIDEGHEQTFNVSHFHFYPLYEDLFAHDLAILEIEPPGLRFDDWTQPICLPPRDFSYQTGRKCVVTGWGSMGLSYPSRLQAAVLPIINREECMNSSRIYKSMSRSAFCAGYLQNCVGHNATLGATTELLPIPRINVVESFDISAVKIGKPTSSL